MKEAKAFLNFSQSATFIYSKNGTKPCHLNK